jgi:hypothetical protein
MSHAASEIEAVRSKVMAASVWLLGTKTETAAKPSLRSRQTRRSALERFADLAATHRPLQIEPPSRNGMWPAAAAPYSGTRSTGR